MTKYEILLFDVDDTLLDFDLAENAALDRMFKEENIAVTSEMIARYKEINESMWRAFERGELTKIHYIIRDLLLPLRNLA